MERRKKTPVLLSEQVIKHSVGSIGPRGDLEFITSGSTSLDLALGGGFAFGKIVNFIGDKSTGKTLFALELIARAKQKYGKKLRWFYDDAEAGLSFNTQKMYGFEVLTEDDADRCSDTVDDLLVNVSRELDATKDDEFLIYVVDSLDSLVGQEEIDITKEKVKAAAKGEIYEKGTFGMEKPKAMSRFFRVLKKKIKEKNCLLIVISQIRAKIGVTFGRKWTRTGGKALDFYAAQVLVLSEAEEYFSKGMSTGVCVRAKVDKNKLGKPYRMAYVEILFDYGVDDIISNLNYLFDMKTDTGKQKKPTKVVAKKGKKSTEDGEEKKSKGHLWDDQYFSTIQGLALYIEENNQEVLLSDAVVDKWEDLEDSVASKRKAKF